MCPCSVMITGGAHGTAFAQGLTREVMKLRPVDETFRLNGRYASMGCLPSFDQGKGGETVELQHAHGKR